MTAQQRPLIDIAEVVAMLSDRIDALVADLLPNAERVGHEWVVGSLDGDPGRSLSICRTGGKAGVWADFSGQDKGDALDLVAGALFGNDKKRAFKWALGWLGLERMDDKLLQKQRARAAALREQNIRKANENRDAQRGRAQRLFYGAEADILGTPVDLYLQGRGIDVGTMPRVPRGLRYKPAMTYKWCPPGEAPRMDPDAGKSFAGMVACVINAEGETIAAHRTFLAQRPDGSWGKAPVGTPPGRDAKMSLGELAGGFIPLWRGANGRTWKDPAADETLAIAEGIENALSIVAKRPAWRVISAVSLKNMGALVLPPIWKDIVICGDNDPNQAEQNALRAAIWRLQDQGRQVRLALPPPEYKDFNDLLRGIRRPVQGA
ncbi:DUF7146 domain-containing protein [Zavarzinia aquatilis]|uniref:Uncharacterized protein n=1 Tax=Zavarzinia aquatilis TaxID=2211142 RepID=A0A317EFV6_9PROT|nr:toprim domain-containing protein [Zavarzinia aquatilis]PWR24970.1 hypothetical protein DKG74_04165 [Zavarzinia aquatilis]